MCEGERGKAYIKAELEEIFSAENRWFAGIALGRPPTDDELVWHYINHGGAENFARKCGVAQGR